MSQSYTRPTTGLVSKRLALAATGVIASLATIANAQFSFTLFHNSDGESALINAPGQVNYGGVARFASKLNQLRTATAGPKLTLNAGDMFLAGPQLDATLSNPAAPFYDALALNTMGYDTMTLGNHEFDFGPAVTRRYINQFTGNPRFLSANLNFSAEPQLAPLTIAPNPRLFKSTVVNVGGQDVGVIGAIYEQVATITTLGGVTAGPVVSAVQTEINLLRSSGVNKIVLASHLQSITEELSLIPLLDGIDVVIAGGGEELMSAAGTLLVPGDSRPGTIAGIANQYPFIRTDSTGKNVALVSTAGKYKYIGQLAVDFNAAGELQTASGAPVRVAALSTVADGVNPDSAIQSSVVDPVQAHVIGLANQRFARTEVGLDGRRSAIRSVETNLGNLVADSIRWQAAKSLSDAGLPTPTRIVGLQNGGGIRNDNILPAATAPGDNFSRLDTFSINAFTNFVSIAQNVSPTKLKQIIEHSIASNQTSPGQFGQWSGVSFAYDPSLAPSSRVLKITLEDGTVIFDATAGGFQAGAPSVALASIDFLFTGGDNYPLTDLSFNRFGITYRDALENYIDSTGIFGGLAALSGLVDTSRYAPLGADNRQGFDLGRRIDVIPEPITMSVVLAGAVIALKRRRR